MFETLRQLHIDEPGGNWYNSLWRVLQAYHDLPGAHWTVALSYRVPTGSSVTHSPVVEPWQSGPGFETYDG